MGSLHFEDFQVMQGFPEGVVHGGLTAQSAFVFDRDRGERITPEETIEKTRLTMALKSHSEDERRRRERISLRSEADFVESSDEDDQSGDISCWRESEERDCFSKFFLCGP